TVDTKAPSATIVLADTALKIGETSLVTITFSEEVSGFALADLTSPNGVLSNLVQDSVDSKKYTATFTPTEDIEDAINVISLADTYTDVAGNSGTIATSANYAIDTLAPTASVTASVTADNVINISEASAPVTITGTNEAGSTVTVNGNAVTTVTGTTWSYVLTTEAIALLDQGDNTLTVVSTDVAGNTTTETKTISVDTVAPITPTITDGITAGSTADNDLVLSENEIDYGITLNGTVSETGLTVQISFDGTTYDENTVTVNGTNWSIILTNAILVKLTGHNQTLYVKATDAAGNSVVTQQNFTLGYDIASNATLDLTTTTTGFVADIYSVGTNSAITTSNMTTLTDASIKILDGALDTTDDLQINLSSAFSAGGYVGIADADGKVSITLDAAITDTYIQNTASNQNITLDISEMATGVSTQDNGMRIQGDMLVTFGTSKGYINIIDDGDILSNNNNQVLKVTDFSQDSLVEVLGFNLTDDLINIRSIAFNDSNLQDVNGDVVDNLADGLLDSSFFSSGLDHTAASTSIFYDTVHGKVYYNSIGSYDVNNTKLLLTLVDDTKPLLTADNFQII
ncbi:Ig-like domain-containing protein, partial [Aliarcobacter cryaerophilus]